MMESDLVKRLMWSGLLTALGGLSAVITSTRVATMIWVRAFGEEPPE